jgi:hypothetical protein
MPAPAAQLTRPRRRQVEIDESNPDLQTVRDLANKRWLAPDQARTRYRAILALLATHPDLSYTQLAELVGCTASNMSRLVAAACVALGVRLDQPV